MQGKRLNESENHQLLPSDHQRMQPRLPQMESSNDSPYLNQYQQPQGYQQQYYQDQQDIGGIHQKPKKELKEPPSHPPTLNHAEFLQDKIYSACYPLSAKAFQVVKSIFKKGNTSVEILDKTKLLLNKDPASEDRSALQNKVLQLKINDISNQELDPNVSHPFVRIHFVDMKTGIYIKKSNPERDCIVRDETITAYEEIAKEYASCKSDLVFPFATNCVDLRETGGARARWNETFYINDDCENILKEDTVILFEILDFNPKQLAARETTNQDSDHFYKVAWGYLRPLGLSKNHFGLSKVQLYKYIFDSHKLQPKQRKHFIPLVYFDFIWPNRTFYDGYLSVNLIPVEKPDDKRVMEKAENIFEVEIDQFPYRSWSHTGKNIKDALTKGVEEEILDKEKIKGKRIREPSKPCEIPDRRMIAKFISDELGCFRLSFSPNGKILAAACTNKKSETCIKFFDVDESFEQIYQFRGHSNLIHCLSWIRSTKNFSLLSTSSSDFSNKIWKVPNYSTTDEFIDEDESEEFYQIGNLFHPSYVYCSQFYPLRKGSGSLTLVTGCFDSYIRIWQINQDAIGQQPRCVHKILISELSNQGENFEQFDNLLEHRHPNCIVFDSQALMFIGDSLGLVHIFSVTTMIDDPTLIRWQRTIKDPQLIGDPITRLHYIQSKRQLIVHNRSNYIRNIEVNQNSHNVIKTYIGAYCGKFPVGSCISPDEVWLLSGSEDGHPHLWHIEGTDESDLKRLEYNIDGTVSDVCWNNMFHMIAIAGFGDDHPISLYVYEEEQDLTVAQYRELRDKLDQQEKMRIQFDLDQDFQQDPYDPVVAGANNARQQRQNQYQDNHSIKYSPSQSLHMYKKHAAKMVSLLMFSSEKHHQSLLIPAIESGYTTKVFKQSILNLKKTAFVYQVPYLTLNQAGMEQSGIVLSSVLKDGTYTDSSYRKFDTYLNPKIIKVGGNETEEYEQCISQIGIESKVKRFEEIKIMYMTEEGNTKEEDITGFRSRIIQQAIDLLCGRLPLKWNISKGENRIVPALKHLQNAQLLEEAILKYNEALLAQYSTNAELFDKMSIKTSENMNIPPEHRNPRFSAREEVLDDFELTFKDVIEELQDELVDFAELNKRNINNF